MFNSSALVACLAALLAGTSAAAPGGTQQVLLADAALGMPDAMTLSIPAGWRFHGEIVRNVPCSPGDPFPQLQTSSPDGAYSMTIMTPFFTTSSRTALDLRTCGAVAPLASAAQILTRYVLPAIRPTVQASQPEGVPEAGGFLRSAHHSRHGVSMSGDAARVRVSYEQNGQAVEEYIVGLTSQLRRRGTPGGTSSTIVEIYRAPAGKLDEFLLEATQSLKVTANPRWQQRSAALAQRAAPSTDPRGTPQRAARVDAAAH